MKNNIKHFKPLKFMEENDKKAHEEKKTQCFSQNCF